MVEQIFGPGRAAMDVFLGHVSLHYIPGRNMSWYAIFVAPLAVYLFVVDRTRQS